MWRASFDSGIGCALLIGVCTLIGACWLAAWGVRLLKAVVALIAGL